jgi:hypothetical protein
MALGPTQPPIQWVSGILSLGIKRLGREADHSPPSTAKVKEWVELYLHSLNTPPWRGAQLKHRDNFTFTFTGPYIDCYLRTGAEQIPETSCVLNIPQTTANAQRKCGVAILTNLQRLLIGP